MTRKELAKATLRKHARIIPSGAIEQTDGPDYIAQMIRFLPGGKKYFLTLIKQAADEGDACAVAWWNVWDGLPKIHKSGVSLSDVAAAAGVKASSLMAGVVGHSVESGEVNAKLIAAVLHPQLVAKAGQSAMRISGPHADVAQRDRQNMMQALGSLPMPRNAQMQVTVNANASAAAAASAAEPSVPKFAEDLAALPEAARGFLPAPTGPTKVIDVEAVPELVPRAR